MSGDGVGIYGCVVALDGKLIAVPIPPPKPISAVFVLPGGGRVRVTSDGNRTVTTDVSDESDDEGVWW